MHPVLLHIGSFELASYGLMTALAYAAAAWYLYKRLHYIQLDKDTFWNIIFIAFVSALLGSKLLYLIVSWPEMGATFAQRLANAVKDIRYGFVFFGGAVTAIAALLVYLKKKKLPVLKTADFLIESNIKYIWNFTPAILKVPADVKVWNENIIASFLQFACQNLQKDEDLF